jgi:hypothetical protein
VPDLGVRPRLIAASHVRLQQWRSGGSAGAVMALDPHQDVLPRRRMAMLLLDVRDERICKFVGTEL